MKRLRKRALSLFLALVMTVSLLPTGVWAAANVDGWIRMNAHTLAEVTVTEYRKTFEIDGYYQDRYMLVVRPNGDGTGKLPSYGSTSERPWDKNAPLESGAMDKAAAGTVELVPIARVTNLSRAIAELKEHNFWVAGMDGYADTTIDKMDKSGKIAIVMGSEGKGMRRLVQENCDSSVKLPINPQVESLNVSTAAAITLYELSKNS